MKKKLLKTPQNDLEVFLRPTLDEIIDCLDSYKSLGTAHQLGFSNPGVAVKFLLLDYLEHPFKKIIFVDTDKANLQVRMITSEQSIYASLSENPAALEYTPSISRENALSFFGNLEDSLKKYPFIEKKEVLDNFFRYKEIFLRNCHKKFLKETLAESFLEFYRIKTDYMFLSKLISSKEFSDFVLKIYRESLRFREIFNSALDEYKDTFRFRYRNYPFAYLKDGELPFWIVEQGQRIPCFKKDIDSSGFGKIKIYPRAPALTLFLRLCKTGLFIHGIGGGNYEWIQDRLIERFFGLKPPLYPVVSATYYLGGYEKRDYPFFLYSPRKLKEHFLSVLQSSGNPS